MNDWADRVVDSALQELHGSKPPDLSARIVMALHQTSPGQLPDVVPALAPATPGRRLVWVWTLVAALLVAVGVGFAAGLLATEIAPRTAAPASVDSFVAWVEVACGRVECVVDGHVDAVGEPDGKPVPFLVAVGNRLVCAEPSTFVIGTFGALVAQANSQLEVRSMEFTKMHGVFAASSLTVAVVAGVVTWHALTRTETAAAGEMLRMEAGASGGALAVENAQLKERLAALEQQNEALRAQAVQRDPAPPIVAPAAVAPVEPPPPPPPPTTTEAWAALFSDPKFAEALAKLDWKTIGTVTSEMGPALAQLVAAMQKEGAEMPMDLAIKVSQLNMKLLEQVPAMMASGLPGFGPNGTYTHPLVVANTLASTLQAAGHALTPAQQQAVAGLVRVFSAESQSIAEAGREFDLEQLLAETEMKDRFFREISGQLQPEQAATIFPPGAGTHDGSSLFSSGLLTQVHAQPVQAKDAADFARIASGKLAEQLGLDEALTAQVKDVLTRAAAAPELWRDRADATETSQLRMMRAGRTQAALRQQLVWMRQVQQLPLTAEQRQKLAKMKNVLVPLPR